MLGKVCFGGIPSQYDGSAASGKGRLRHILTKTPCSRQDIAVPIKPVALPRVPRGRNKVDQESGAGLECLEWPRTNLIPMISRG